MNKVAASTDQVLAIYWVPIIGIILYVLLDVVAQSVPPHYSPIRDAESDLAVGQYGYFMAINFVIRGILSLAFVYAFIKTLDLAGSPKAPFRYGLYLLGIWAVGSILLAVFPTDVPAMPISSLHGAIHTIVAIIAFIGGAFGTLLLSRCFDQSAATKGAKKFALRLSSLSVLLLAIALFIPSSVGVFGLTERLFVGSVLLWMFVISTYVVVKKRTNFELDSSGLKPE